MKTFRVTIKEVHNQDYLIEADSPEEAIEKVEQGDGDIQEDSFDYSFTLPSQDWIAEEEKQDSPD